LTLFFPILPGNDQIKRFDKVREKACRDAKIGVRIFNDSINEKAKKE
jgi:hypothetical protein